ncbi:MAG: hypothetical protein WAU06_11835, partial [Candidatus Nanopelagicales bacterium]
MADCTTASWEAAFLVRDLIPEVFFAGVFFAGAFFAGAFFAGAFFVGVFFVGVFFVGGTVSLRCCLTLTAWDPASVCRRNSPVWLASTSETCSGVPVATTVPPPDPPSGP